MTRRGIQVALLVGMLYLLAGALLTVAIAWGCALWGDREGFTAATDPWLWQTWQMNDADRQWIEANGWTQPATPSLNGPAPAYWPAEWKPGMFWRARAAQGLQRWSASHEMNWDLIAALAQYGMMLPSETIMLRVRSGWPWPALAGEYWPDERNAGVAARTRRAWLIESAGPSSAVALAPTPPQGVPLLVNPGPAAMAGAGGANTVRILPWGVEWRGFALNTLFFAAVLVTLRLSFRGAQRYRRIVRGLCPSCAYPIGVSPQCSECGQRVRPRAAHRLPSTKALARLAVLAIVLGPITSLGMAFLCALYMPVGPDPSIFLLPRDQWWTSRGGRPIPTQRASGIGYEENVLIEGSWQCVFMRSGWPCRAFEGSVETWKSQTTVVNLDHRVAQSPAWLVDHSSARAHVPIKPVRFGLIANAIAHAAGLFAMGTLIAWRRSFGVLRHWRIRRGLCPKCANPIGSSNVCTECGHSLA